MVFAPFCTLGSIAAHMVTASHVGYVDFETLKLSCRMFVGESIEVRNVVVWGLEELDCSVSCGRDLCWRH